MKLLSAILAFVQGARLCSRSLLQQPLVANMLRSKLIERQNVYLRAALPALRVHGLYC